MNTLFLDLASHQNIIACCDDTRVISKYLSAERISDTQLIEHLENALEKAGLKYKDINRLAGITGPGGFTSLRVTVACLNTLMNELNIPAAGIHLSDLYKARSAEKDVIWIHSTKKALVFVRGFGKYAGVWPEPVCLELNDLQKELPLNAQIAGELIAEHQAILEKNQTINTGLKKIFEVLPGFLGRQKYDHKIMEPWYGRTW